MSDDPAARRVGSRLRSRFAIALIAGPIIGLAGGALIAVIAFDTWGRGSVMVLIGAAVAATLLALLWAGYSSLESPDPGREPSDTQHPIADRPQLTREENDDALDRDTRAP